jgi:hypothetical protein
MQGTGTGAAAMLVGSAEDVGGRPDAATVTLERDEIQEALASDAPLDLILSVQAGDTEPRDVRVTWQREDLETVLGKVETGPVTFSFDRAELYRALEHPDFEGHGMREIVLLVAAASSSAALMASTASAQVLDTGGGGAVGAVMDASGGGTTGAVMDAAGGGMTGAAMDAAGGGTTGAAMDAAGGGTTGAAMDAAGGGTTGAAMDAAGGSGGAGAAVVPGHGEASTASGLEAAATPVPGHAEATTAGVLAASAAIHDETGATARGIGQTVPGSDEATLVARGIDPAIATAIGSGDATTARDLATPAAIHDETGASARGIGQTVPGNDEATLVARGIDPAIATAIGSGDATTARDLATPAAPAAGSSFDLPSIDAGTAAVVGGLAGAGLLILGGAFAARRQRVTPV